MIFAVILGGIIGFERRASERPAGIRTMSMVCLGSCFFSMTGQLAFKSSTMGWDAARVAAAVPSGVGFLGAGLIWKGSRTTSLKNIHGEEMKSTSQEVHGLTTAASVWLSAAVGVAVGGGQRLYIVSMYGVSLVILVLRFGPELYFVKDSESMMDFDDEVDSAFDWESFTDDSSRDLSQSGHDHEDSDYEYRRESTMWGSAAHIEYPSPTDGHGNSNTAKKVDGTRDFQTKSSSLSREHASAPNLMMMTYEVPIVDHSREKSKGSKPVRRRGKSRNNILKLSFHG